jgi:hypothetical protein
MEAVEITPDEDALQKKFARLKELQVPNALRDVLPSTWTAPSHKWMGLLQENASASKQATVESDEEVRRRRRELAVQALKKSLQGRGEKADGRSGTPVVAPEPARAAQNASKDDSAGTGRSHPQVATGHLLAMGNVAASSAQEQANRCSLAALQQGDTHVHVLSNLDDMAFA